MSNFDNQDKGRRRHSIFETIDSVTYNLHLSKKMFLIMIITAMIIPPAMLTIVVIGMEMTDGGPRVIKLNALIDQLENKEISSQEFVDETRYVQSAPLYGGPKIGFYLNFVVWATMLFWIGYGIRQWIVHNRLNNEYRSLTTVQSLDLQNTAGKRKNLFEIADYALHELNSTKKIFFIMLVLAIAIPPLLMTGFALLVVEPIHGPLLIKTDELLSQLENNEITAESFVEQYRDVRSFYLLGNGKSTPLLFVVVIKMVISSFWVWYGIKQWISHTKWNKKYLKFQTRDDEINHKLGET